MIDRIQTARSRRVCVNACIQWSIVYRCMLRLKSILPELGGGLRRGKRVTGFETAARKREEDAHAHVCIVRTFFLSLFSSHYIVPCIYTCASIYIRTSSGSVYSMISVQRLEDLMVPRFFWLLLLLHASLNSMYGVPVSTFRDSDTDDGGGGGGDKDDDDDDPTGKPEQTNDKESV